MRELSRREFYLVAICPGLLIALIYYLLIDSSSRNLVQSAQQSVVGLHRTVTSLDQTIAAVKLNPPSRNLGNRQGSSTLSEQINALARSTGWTSTAGRINALHAIASTFGDHDLVIMSRQTDAASKRVVPSELLEFAVAAKTDADQLVPEVWRLEFIGSYGNLQVGLDQLSRSGAFLIPLAISMDLLPEDPTRQVWTLWVWV